jgi:thiamine-monophosphate kinase
MEEIKSEDGLIAWIKERCARGSDDLLIGIGDDMAMVRAGVPGGMLATSDMLMDGVDFDTAVHAPEMIGRKALAVSLSDCAAMAVRPRWAMVSVALRNNWSMEQAKGLFEGIIRLAEEFDCRIVGGDTNSWDKPLVVDVTVLAEPWGLEKKPEGDDTEHLVPVQRGGMKPNDLIVVTGELGGSIAGHHLSFTPRVHEARRLRIELGGALHAMMDLSDGISVDAARMARASGCGIVFKESTLSGTASAAALKVARNDGRTILDHVLNDGEDFELLFAVDPDVWMSLEKSRDDSKKGQNKWSVPHRIVGTATDQKGIWLMRTSGACEEIKPRGWRHFQDA